MSLAGYSADWPAPPNVRTWQTTREGGVSEGSWRSLNLAGRLRAIRKDLVTLIGGIALLLVWAGIVEAFFSQYHEPVVPYAAKITFGVIQLTALAAYLGLCGRQPTPAPSP